MIQQFYFLSIYTQNNWNLHKKREERKKNKVGSQRDICTLIVTSILFKIGKTWNRPKCPSTDWVSKIWCVYAFIWWISRFKKEGNSILSFFLSLMLQLIKLKDIMIKMSVTERQILYDSTHTRHWQQLQSHPQEGSRITTQGLGSYCLIDTEFWFHKMKGVLEIDGSDSSLWVLLISF